jgi:NitT/TauT family transport system substrate-binding protein
MNKLIMPMLAGALALATASSAMANDPIKLQIKWVTQSQFAGYYVAKSKGFYADEGLDVTILPGGPTTPVPAVMAANGADVAVDWAAEALIAREKGIQMVNIAQPFKKAGLELICPKDGPIKSEKDFAGHTLGSWFYGNEYPFFAWMHKLGLSTDGGPTGVTVLQQAFDVSALVQHKADCISVMTYNELGQAADAGYTADKIIQFNYSALGNDLLEDGLYVMQDRLADPKFKDDMVKFVRASMKGWDYALAHPDESAQIVVDSDDSGAATLAHERYMVGEVAKLMAGANGVLDKAVWDRTVQALLDQKLLTKQPDAESYTTAITDAAFAK